MIILAYISLFLFVLFSFNQHLASQEQFGHPPEHLGYFALIAKTFTSIFLVVTLLSSDIVVKIVDVGGCSQ